MAASKKLSVRLTATGGESLKRQFGQLGKEGQQAFNRIAQSSQGASVELKAVDASARAFNGVLRQAAGLVGAYASIQGISRSLGFIVSTNREFECLQASLKTVTGSLSAADSAFSMIERFAASTPFNIEQITEAFIKLKALGLDPSEAALQSYGNTASAMGKNLMQFVEAIADAATGEFERLKEFGIKARTQGEQVTFTFQGIQTRVDKTAAAIEHYLRRIGQVQFAGAMAEQMNTLGGIFSNIEDNFGTLAREVGKGGLNDAIREVASSLKVATDQGQSAAHALGETLGDAVRLSAQGMGFLWHNATLLAEGLGTLLVARTVGRTISAMTLTMSGNAGAISALQLMRQGAIGTAAKLVVLEGAAKVSAFALGGLRSVMMALGGPAGVIMMAGFALYQLAKGHDVAAKAAKDHAKEMAILRSQMANTTTKIDTLNQASHPEALARWTQKLHLAQDNISAVRHTLQQKSIGSFGEQFRRSGSVLQSAIIQTQRAFREGTLSVDAYQQALWKLAVKYPEFTEDVKGIKEQILALKAAQMAAVNAQQHIDQLRSPSTIKSRMKTQNAPNPVAPTLPHHAIARTPALSGASTPSASGNDPAVEALQAQQQALQSLTQTRAEDAQQADTWQKELKAGMEGVLDHTQQMTTQTQQLFDHAFEGISSAMSGLIRTGKLDFTDFTDSIIRDISRITIQHSITDPLSQALGSIHWGALFGMAHTGGVIGVDPLASKRVHPAVFETAARFHSGGIVGNEVPVIAQRGEAILTPGQMRLLGNRWRSHAPVQVKVNVHNHAPGVKARVEHTQQQGSVQLDIIVEQIEAKLQHHVSRGEGLAPTLEQRYGLNPAAGSYR